MKTKRPLREADILPVHRQRFWDKVIPNPMTGCYLWTGSVSNIGYGTFKVGQRTHVAHRVAFAMQHGEAPTDKDLDHLCRVRCCVNPAHLLPSTHAENCRRSPDIGGSNKYRTHCIHGHPLSGENLYVHGGRRYCRTCRRHRLDAARGKQ